MTSPARNAAAAPDRNYSGQTNKEKNMETIHDIAEGLRRVAGMRYPHPNNPEECNEAAARELDDLAGRIERAHAAEMEEAGYTPPGPQDRNELTIDIKSTDFGLYHRTVKFEGGPFMVFTFLKALEQNIETASEWITHKGKVEGEKR